MKKQVFTVGLFVASVGAAFSQSTIWQPYNSNLDTSAYVRYLSVVDTNTVWGVGFLGSHTNTNWFTRTINGADFHAGNVFPDTTQYNISNISAVDGNTAYVAAYFIAATGASGKIMKTTNGGATWTTASDSSTMFVGANNFPDWVHFWDANNGIALGDPNGNTAGGGLNMFEIWRTNNGGTNWARVADANVPAPLSGEFGLTNSYTTWKGYIWSGTSDGARVYASADSGKTWTVNTTTLNLAGGISGLAFRDSLNGLLLGDTVAGVASTKIMKTADGGATWATVTTNSTVGTSDISRIPKTKGYMSVGLNGTGNGYVTSVSYDDATTWTVLETGVTNPVRMLSVRMLDSLNGWAGNFSTNVLPYGTNGINRYRLGHNPGCPITLTSSSASTPFNVCSGGTDTLTASGLNTYTWSTSASTASITVTPSVTTSYSVAGTTTAGCSNYETFNITVISPSVSVVSHTICPGANQNLLAVGNVTTYSWSTGATTFSTSVTPTVTTTYTLTGTLNLCPATATPTVTVKPAPSIMVTTSTGTVSLCSGSTATLSAMGASTYTWSTAVTGSSITVTPTVTTTYSVTGTGTVNTCTSMAVITETVTNCVGIEQFSADNQISLYPNPSTGLVTISIANVANTTVMYVTNMLGQEVIKTSIKDVNTNLDLSSLQKGMYTLTIINGESKHIEKLIIQ